MKFNIANPATGQQKLIDIEDERKACVSTLSFGRGVGVCRLGGGG
jgi:hypothetical protein